MKLSEDVIKQFTEHVLAEYPKEAVGVVINGNYVPCQNIHPQPTIAFKIDAQYYLSLKSEPVQCLLHSHPYDKNVRRSKGDRPEYPSSTDIENFNQCGFPWGIVSTDGTGLSAMEFLDENDIPPLDGRTFFWGVRDCYSLVRDWYKLNRGIKLFNAPRQYGFWDVEGAENPFLKFSTEQYGWQRVPPEKVEVGDVALMRMGDRRSTGIINHCGVVSGPNQLFHQTLFGISYRTDLHKWNRSIASYHRYVGAK